MEQIIPITPNSGGVPQPNNIVGRDEIIQEYWNILKYRGISLSAERRVGKSCVVRKMHHQTQTGFVTIYKSVFGIDHPDNFVDALYEYAKLHKLFSPGISEKIDSFWNKFTARVRKVAGAELSQTNTIWQEKIIYLFTQILDSQPNNILVVFLDEFSLMLDKMKSEEANLVLGTLRDIVHDYFPTQLRFVYTSSIGIELILDKIRSDGHNLGSPLNHLEKKKLPPFNQDQANYFCLCLEKGCKISISQTVRDYIIEITDGFPYFIDRIFEKIRHCPLIERSTIDEAFDKMLNDASNSTNLKHFYDRIEDYYPDKELSNHLLNIICQCDQAISENDIANQISTIIIRDRSTINDDLERLWSDAYLIRHLEDGKRHYTFQYHIIKMWWRINKAYAL